MAYHSKYSGAEVDSLLDKIKADDVGGIDSSLSTTSENPVKNKVITEELNKKVNETDIATINGQPLTNGGNIEVVTEAYDDTEINSKLTELDSKSQRTLMDKIGSVGLSNINNTTANVISFNCVATEPWSIPFRQLQFQLYTINKERHIDNMSIKFRIYDISGDYKVDYVSLTHADLVQDRYSDYLVSTKVVNDGVYDLFLDLSDKTLPYGDVSLPRFYFFLGTDSTTSFNKTWKFKLDIISAKVNGEELINSPFYTTLETGLVTGATFNMSVESYNRFITENELNTSVKQLTEFKHRMYFPSINNIVRGKYAGIKLYGSTIMDGTTIKSANENEIIVNGIHLSISRKMYRLNQVFYDTIEIHPNDGKFYLHKRSDLVDITSGKNLNWGYSEWNQTWWTSVINSYNEQMGYIHDCRANGYHSGNTIEDDYLGIGFDLTDGNLCVTHSNNIHFNSQAEIESYINEHPIIALIPIQEQIIALSDYDNEVLRTAIDNSSYSGTLMADITLYDREDESFSTNYKNILPIGVEYDNIITACRFNMS